MTEAEVPVGRVDRSPSLVDKVTENLTEAIVSGQLKSGQRLPPERDLAEQLGVSRTVVRESVRSLAARGLVTITSGRGVEVAPIDTSTVSDALRLFMRGRPSFDYRQIHEVRTTIEITTVALAAERATDQDIRALENLCNELERQLEVENFEEASRLDFEFHRTLIAATGNELFLIVIDSISDTLQEIRNEAYPLPGVGANGLAEHREILKRVADHEAGSARIAMTAHLEHAKTVWERVEGDETTLDR